MPLTTRRRSSLLIIPLILPGLAAPAWADESAEIENLRRRLEKLEGGETESEGLTSARGHKIPNLWGALEVEASYLATRDQPAGSELHVATALLGFDVDINERIAGRLALLHEDGEEPEVALDEAHLAVSWPAVMAGSVTVTTGRNYLPFGNFASTMVSDPLTLELGETRKTALLAGWGNDQVTLQLGIFNGARDTSGHEVIDNGIAAVTLAATKKVGCGLSYLCDLAETNLDLLADTTTDYTRNVDAWSAYLAFDFSPVSLNLEYLGALKDFSEAMLADPGRAAELTGRRPRAWFAEIGFAPNNDWAFSGRYEQVEDYQDNVARLGVTASYGLDLNTVLSVEYLYSDFDREVENTASQVTCQLALEF